MKNSDLFSEWMKNNTELSDSSIYKYTHAVNSISNDMINNGVINKNIFNMSLMELDSYIPKILNNDFFLKKNSKGNSMYSNSLKQYRMFYCCQNTDNLTSKEIENAIENYDAIDKTERESIVKSRVGQGLFKKRLIEKYDSKCIITGICLKKILIASHIKPWSVSNNHERLSSENGLLLSPTYDKLFDTGLISFENNGKILLSKQIRNHLTELHLADTDVFDLKASNELKEYLEYHRDIIYVK